MLRNGFDFRLPAPTSVINFVLCAALILTGLGVAAAPEEPNGEGSSENADAEELLRLRNLLKQKDVDLDGAREVGAALTLNLEQLRNQLRTTQEQLEAVRKTMAERSTMGEQRAMGEPLAEAETKEAKTTEAKTTEKVDARWRLKIAERIGEAAAYKSEWKRGQNRIQQLLETERQSQELLQERNEQLEDARGELDEKTRALDSARQLQQQLAADAKLEANRLAESTLLLGDVRSQLKQAREQFRTSTVAHDQQVANLNEELVAAKSALVQRDEELQRARMQLAQTRNDRTRDTEKLTANLERTQQQLDERQASLVELKGEQNKLIEARQASEDNVRNLRKELAAGQLLAEQLREQLDSRQQELARQNDELQSKVRGLNASKAEVDRYRTTLNDNRKTYRALKEQHAELQVRLKFNEEEAAKRKQELTQRTEKAGALTEKLNISEQKIREMKAQSVELQDQLAKRTEALAQNEGSLKAQRVIYERLQLEKEATEKAREAASQQVARLQTDLQDRQAAVEQLRKQLASAKQEIEQLSNRLTAKSDEAAVLAKELQSVRDTLAEQRTQIAILSKDRTRLLEFGDRLSQESARLQDRLNAATSRTNELDQRVADLMEETKRPSSLSLTRAGTGWRLAGEVEDESTKQRIATSVREAFEITDGKLQDAIKVHDRIKPSRWARGLPDLLGQLREKHVEGLEVSIEDDTIEIHGEVISEISRTEIVQLINDIDW